jgi:hypothetical protein
VSGPAPRRDWSLLLHVPIDHPEDAGLWWVDLVAGMELARLAALARKVRRRAGMFLPAEPPAPPLAPHPSAFTALMAAEDPVVTAAFAPPLADAEEPRSITLTPDEAKAAGIAHAIDSGKQERTILGLIQAARTSADLVKIWERYGQDVWTPACTAAADAHLVTLRVSS